MSSARRGRALLVLAAVATASACASPGPAGKLRFANQAPVWRVNDRADVAAKPANRPFVRMLYHSDTAFFRRITLAMEVAAPRRAMNTNALDEVPDSTWFTNRIGVRDVSLAEIARGPNSDVNGPDRSAPWRVVGSKVGGQSVGLLIEDNRGVKYLLKFDEPDYPVIETATDVVVQRLLWACGYNVPEDDIVYFTAAELVLAADATVKDVFGNERPMRPADLDEALSNVHRNPDGSYRGLVSKYLPGVPIGGFPQRGVRRDDGNDRIPHQHRRELRGLYVFYSWLQYTDAKENNTLDVWEADPDDAERHYVVHYLVDFGKSLGANATISKFVLDGHRYMVDIVDVPLSLLRFGLVKRPWEGTAIPAIEGVGMFDVDHFEPGGFQPHDAYSPFTRKDVHDAFWAAKILVRFTPAQIRAAVEQGKYSDQRAVDYITETLTGRARKAAAYWFARTNPIADFAVSGVGADDYRLCFDDLPVRHQLDEHWATRYRLRAYDFAGRALAWQAEVRATPSGRVCASGFAAAPSHDGYTIISITTERDGVRAPVLVHLAAAPSSGGLRIIGLHRR